MVYLEYILSSSFCQPPFHIFLPISSGLLSGDRPRLPTRFWSAVDFRAGHPLLVCCLLGSLPGASQRKKAEIAANRAQIEAELTLASRTLNDDGGRLARWMHHWIIET